MRRLEQVLGNYHLIKWLGSGGFADVYLAEHVSHKRLVAIKVLRAELVDHYIQTFIDEARIAYFLNHPHIVDVFGFGVEEQVAYLLMEYAHNGTVEQRYPFGSRVLPSTVLHLLRPIVDAVQYIHDQGYVHGDIKPENILLGPNNELWLSDFGVTIDAYEAALGNNEIRGTVAFMAPERLRTDGYSCFASDQYAIAIMVYGWLYGTLPFRGTTDQIIDQHLHEQPSFSHTRAPIVSQAIKDVLLKALAKYPEERFESVQEFYDALEVATHTRHVRGGISATRHAISRLEPTVRIPTTDHIGGRRNARMERLEPITQVHNAKNDVWKKLTICLACNLLISLTLLCVLIALHIAPIFLEGLLALCPLLLPCIEAYVKKMPSLFFLHASMTVVAMISGLVTHSLVTCIVIYHVLLLLSLLTTFTVSMGKST